MHDRVSGPTLSGLYGLGREFDNYSSGASGARASIFGFPLSEKTQRLPFTHKRLPMHMPDSHGITMLDAVNESSKHPRTDAQWHTNGRHTRVAGRAQKAGTAFWIFLAIGRHTHINSLSGINVDASSFSLDHIYPSCPVASLFRLVLLHSPFRRPHILFRRRTPSMGVEDWVKITCSNFAHRASERVRSSGSIQPSSQHA